MSEVIISTPFYIDLEFQLAPFHKRLFAWFIDSLIVYLYAYGVYRFFSGYIITDQHYGLLLICYSPIFVYHLFWELMNNGQSPGKKMFSLKLISETGGAPNTSQYLIRWMFRIIDFPLTFFMGGLISVLTSKNSQRIGDRAAGTILIYKESNKSLSDIPFVELAQNYTPNFDRSILKISDSDINTIKRILNDAIRSNDHRQANSTADLIKNKMQIESKLLGYAFLESLIKDYNYYTNIK